jgi:hypothetical protein
MNHEDRRPEDRRFTCSTCECDFCINTHKCVRDWSSYEPETHLQTRMKDVVRRIERRIEIAELMEQKRKTKNC